MKILILINTLIIITLLAFVFSNNLNSIDFFGTKNYMLKKPRFKIYNTPIAYNHLKILIHIQKI
jgi:hypothetical protein